MSTQLLLILIGLIAYTPYDANTSLVRSEGEQEMEF